MRRSLVVALALLCVAALAPTISHALNPRRAGVDVRRGSVVTDHDASAGAEPAAAATERLALALLPKLGGTGNVVVSPLSVETALAMVDQGAAGTTAAQIDRVLGATGPAALAAANAALAVDLAAAAARPRAPTLTSADAVWLQAGFPVAPAFTGALSSAFGAAPQPIDFRGSAAAAAQQINAWVAQHTGGLIPQLMPVESITAQTELVLVNALYLKALWAKPFSPAATSDQAFTAPGATAVRVPFMSQAAAFGYATGPGFRAVELPYAHSQLSLVVIMPSDGTLAQYQRSLTSAGFDAVLSALHTVMLECGSRGCSCRRRPR